MTPATRRDRRSRLILLVWLLLTGVAAVYAGHQALVAGKFYTNVMELIPDAARDDALHELSRLLGNRFEDRALFLIGDGPGAADAARFLHERLAADPAFVLEQPGAQDLDALALAFRPFSQQLLTSETRTWLAGNDAEAIARQTQRNLFAPVQAPRPYPFGEDPFNLGWPWLEHLLPDLDFQSADGQTTLVDATGKTWYVLTARIVAGSAFELPKQQAMAAVLEAYEQRFAQVETITSGMIFHAMAGTRQARLEISTVGLGSLAGILALTFWTFRGLRPLLLVTLTLAAAATTALAGCFLVFGRIHLLTLAFGTTLLGLAVDYVYHFLMSRGRHQVAGVERKLTRALALGVTSSTLAYLLQWLTPFPGLQQMAGFCAFGLPAAWFALVALAPFYRGPVDHRPPPTLVALAGRMFAGYRFLAARRNRTAGALAAAMMACIGVIALRGANDSLVHLSTSPAALLAAEQRTQTLLKAPSSNQYFYLQAASGEDLLELSQRLDERLRAYRDEAHRDIAWRSVSQFVPSATQQRRDRALIEDRLYGANGALARLGALLDADLSAPPPANAVLTPADLDGSPVAALLPPLARADDDAAGPWHSLTLLTGEIELAALTAIAEELEGVRFENTTRTISEILRAYRTSVAESLLFALVVLTVLFGWLYRWRALRAAAALTCAVLVALAASATAGVTLFHLIALLLVIGIGIDTSAFYLEFGVTLETWLAATVSSATSVLAFGLLALSKVPVLHQFGCIVLFGMVTCWLVSPVFYRVPSPSGGTL